MIIGQNIQHYARQNI